MFNLKLSEWANVAEIVVAVVIVGSLVYVGLELNQNTVALQESSYQDTLGELAMLDLAVVENAELHGIVSTGEDNPTALSEEEWSRFTHFVYHGWGSGNIFF